MIDLQVELKNIVDRFTVKGEKTIEWYEQAILNLATRIMHLEAELTEERMRKPIVTYFKEQPNDG